MSTMGLLPISSGFRTYTQSARARWSRHRRIAKGNDGEDTAQEQAEGRTDINPSSPQVFF